MGLLSCPASFQQLMEGVLGNILYVIVYIDDLLVHTKTHEEHLNPGQSPQMLATSKSTLTNVSSATNKFLTLDSC
jgi:hypothetical protein